MLKKKKTFVYNDLEFTVVYSGRRSLGISVMPDSSVILRVPYLTSLKTINRVVEEKKAWITWHRDNYRNMGSGKISRTYINGESHLFRGVESVLQIEKIRKSYILFYDSTIKLGLEKSDDERAIKKLLYKGYKAEAWKLFPEIMDTTLQKHENQMFKPAGLIIKTMKRRWGSCSNKGIITLSTELIKLPDQYIEYVIVHELCHLRHHNHGAGFYKLLTDLYPNWKQVRKDLRKYIQ